MVKLLVLLVLASFSVKADTFGEWEYTVDQGEATITRSKDRWSLWVVFPVKVNGLPVKTIGNGSRPIINVGRMQSITIPDGVTSIGRVAFYQSLLLTNVQFGNTLTNIGKGAFSSCPKIQNLTFPDSLKNIEDTAFNQCGDLTNIVLSKNLTNIGSFNFLHLEKLESVIIPNSVKSIGNGVFSYCPKLTNVQIGNNITNIGNSAFRDCSSLTSISIPSSVKRIESGAFRNCISLTNITISEKTDIKIERLAFGNCPKLPSEILKLIK